MQQALGLDVRWLDAGGGDPDQPDPGPDGHRGGSFREGDGHIDPPRNVRAYSLAMAAAGVELREGVAFTGLHLDAGGRVTGVETSAGPIATDRVLLTGGPSLRAVGERAGLRIPVGAARHTVAVLEPDEAFLPPHPDGLRPRRGAVLAAGGGWPALRLERPGRPAGHRPRDRLGGLRALSRAAGRLRAARPRPRAAPHLGGDHRLHARPHADHRPGHHARRSAPRRASPWPRRPATG